MKILKIEQNTPEWLEFRKKGIGASDVPAIMGTCDFRTPFKVWEDKTGRAKPVEANWQMKRGTENESKIRSIYELKTGIEAPALMVEHDTLNFMRASLDGYNEENGVIVEIKYPSKEKHALAEQGVIPQTYQDQIQAQLFVSGAKRCDYVSFNGNTIAIVQVYPNTQRLKDIAKVCSEFWMNNVLRDVPPELTDRDYHEVTAPNAMEWAENYKRLKMEIELREQKLSEIKKTLIEMAGKNSRVKCNGVKISMVERKGSVDYSSIPEIKNIDLNNYRKPNTVYWEIRVDKNETK